MTFFTIPSLLYTVNVNCAIVQLLISALGIVTPLLDQDFSQDWSKYTHAILVNKTRSSYFISAAPSRDGGGGDNIYFLPRLSLVSALESEGLGGARRDIQRAYLWMTHASFVLDEKDLYNRHHPLLLPFSPPHLKLINLLSFRLIWSGI